MASTRRAYVSSSGPLFGLLGALVFVLGAAGGSPLEPPPPAPWQQLLETAQELDAMGQATEAIAAAQEAVETARLDFGTLHANTARAYEMLGLLREGHGQVAEAQQALIQATDIRLVVLGRQHEDTTKSLQHLANLYRAQGAYIESEGLLHKALRWLESARPVNEVGVASLLSDLAVVYYLDRKSVV